MKIKKLLVLEAVLSFLIKKACIEKSTSSFLIFSASKDLVSYKPFFIKTLSSFNFVSNSYYLVSQNTLTIFRYANTQRRASTLTVL